MKILIEESVLRQALEALESSVLTDKVYDAITALRSALEAAEQVEPVAWWEEDESALSFKPFRGGAWTPLYAAPRTDELRAAAQAVCLIEQTSWMGLHEAIDRLREALK